MTYNADLEMYHVYGNMPGQSYQYPPATYFYNRDADTVLNPDFGWCDFSAPSCLGRSHGDEIHVNNGLKAILAYKRDGAYLDAGVLDSENKLDGEGPFRVVVPQKYPGQPDQSSKSDKQDVLWPYDENLDHNAGACSRSATIIKVEPLPAGTTDIDILEAGWAYVDQAKIIVYGAIDGTDSNGNGVLDSEEGADNSQDMDNDGMPDYRDPDTCAVRNPNNLERIRLHTSSGQLARVSCVQDTDTSLQQTGKPNREFPYGVNKFLISGLTAGETVTLTLLFPDDIPTAAQYYKVDGNSGWRQVPFESNDGDNQITLTLTDGDPLTDADGTANGIIDDPGAITTAAASTQTSAGSGGGGGGCFVSIMQQR